MNYNGQRGEGGGGWSVERGEKGMEGSGLGIKGKMGGIGICERVGERGKKGEKRGVARSLPHTE